MKKVHTLPPSHFPSFLLSPSHAPSLTPSLPHSSLLGTRESVVRTEPEFRGGSLFLAPLIARSPLSPGPAISQPPDPSLSPNGVAKDAWYYTPNGFCLQSRVKPTLHFLSREQKLLYTCVWLFLCALSRVPHVECLFCGMNDTLAKGVSLGV